MTRVFGLVWSGSGYVSIVGSCEHDNKHYSSVNY